MSYKTWTKRKENATPYANDANCRRCRYGEWARTSAFCVGRGYARKIPLKEWWSDEKSYCPEYVPMRGYVKEKEDEKTIPKS